MSDPLLGHYHFIPSVRQGIALAVTTADDPANPADVRPELDASVQVVATKNGTAASPQPAGVAVRLHGHGDVVGFDRAQVIKTEPRHGTPNFEPNYFVGIEFDQPGFPWLFTPAAPNGERQLRPWMSLIVLAATEFSIPKDPPIPMPRIEVTDLHALPDLSQSWAWAHAQVTGDLPADSLRDIMKNDPGRATSRLLCPRKLDPDTHYTAFLVPSFEAGRLAGIGADVSMAPKTVPAWSAAAQTPLVLPVYYQFEFTTSDRGDFESLVRQLQPRVLPPELGFRALDASKPFPPDFPGAGDDPLLLAGALRPVPPAGWVEPPWNDPGKSNFQNALTPLINLTSPATDDPDYPNVGGPNNGDPAVVPPIYGRWHAGVTSVQPGAPGWVNDVNLDPRTRSMAGFGTRVVDNHRVPLMASAWQQVAGIERANQLLRQAQLARGAMVAAFSKHFQAAGPEALLGLTQRIHSKIAASPQTVRGTIAQSRLPVRALSGAFRRATRPLGPIRRRQGATAVPIGQLAGRLNSGEVTLVPPPHPPGGMVSLDDISDQLYPSWIPAWLRPFLKYAFWFLIALAIVAAFLIIVIGALLGLLAIAVGIAIAVAGALIALALALRGAWIVPDEVRFTNITPATVKAVPPRPVFQIMPAGQPIPPGSPGPADSADAAAFRAAAGRLAGALQAPPPDAPPPPPADIPALQTTILIRVDPMVTVPARMAALVQISPTLPWHPSDPIAPVMAYPEFTQPMYLPLRDLSQDYLLPGLKFVPPDTLTLLETNEAFVEAYMLGLCHEMSRQLLWNEYPTDQRGTYFQQFWDVRSYVPTPTDPTDPDALKEKLRDIRPIHQWPKDQPLGSNQNRAEVKPGNLVLLVRGELLRRYPNAIIYACHAQWGGEGQPRTLSDAEMYPLFRGTMDPDVTFFGFDLTEDAARGGDQAQGGDPGWFFIFQQAPSEPRFGMEPTPKDPVATWADLAWSDFAFAPSTAGAPIFAQTSVDPQNVKLQVGPDNADDTNNAWGKDSAQTAYILFRRPARIAIHADLMLPRRPAA
jgi:hypothetical protein